MSAAPETEIERNDHRRIGGGWRHQAKLINIHIGTCNPPPTVPLQTSISALIAFPQRIPLLDLHD